MPKITLDISDKTFRSIKRAATVKAISHGGLVGIMHVVCYRISGAEDGETVQLKLEKK